jgi:hypothetical protein
VHDPAEVDSRDARPRRSDGLTFVGLILGAVLAALLFSQLGQLADPSQRPAAVVAPAVAATTASPDLPTAPETVEPIGMATIRRCPANMGGLTLGDHLDVNGWSHVRWDCSALKGPWSVVIRAAHGHFGVHGAVVTFPVPRAGTGTETAATRPRGAVWRSARQLVWPLAGAHAQIVGDTGQAQLVDLATRITVESGKPRLPGPDGLVARYVLEATTTYRSPVVHEMHYRTRDLGQERLGDGLVYTGLMSGAALESQAFAARARPAGFVRGHPAIYSGGEGDDRTLAWESGPGEVAYIGVSGAPTKDAAITQADAVEYLRALADGGRPLTPAQWEAKDRIAVGGQYPAAGATSGAPGAEKN